MWFIIEKTEIPGIMDHFNAASVRSSFRTCHDAYPSIYRHEWSVGPSPDAIRRHLYNFYKHSHLYTGYRKPDGTVRWVKRIQTPRRRRNIAFLKSLLPRVLVAGNRPANQVQRRMAAFTSPAMFRLILVWARFALTGGRKNLLAMLCMEGLIVPSSGWWYVMDYVI